jgi:hypothetical protein
MAEDKVTAWQLPAVLLELVSETAPLIAKVAVEACDVLAEEVPDVAESSKDADESAYDEVLAEVGRKLRVELDPYSLAAEIFSPVFQSALDAKQLDKDLIRRCCDFLERAFSGEKYAAEGMAAGYPGARRLPGRSGRPGVQRPGAGAAHWGGPEATTGQPSTTGIRGGCRGLPIEKGIGHSSWQENGGSEWPSGRYLMARRRDGG